MSVRAGMIAGGVTVARAHAEAPLAAAAMRERGITSEARASMFLAQVLHESVLLAFFEEIASGAEYEGRHDLGNTHPGDGRRYKGRGPIQLTGRANYRLAGHVLGLPLEEHPELASRHDIGWRIAAWYWQQRGLNALADQGDFVGVTARINGATFEGPPTWLSRRRQLLARVRTVDCRPRSALAVLTVDERALARRYDHLVKLKHHGHDTHARRQERVRLRAAMRRRRKALWHVAQRYGWEHRHRRERYRQLRKRST